ncbi:MAG: radical SAM family heme chaperone HemW [Actinomycetota bacterium]|nr:radical SAM family heme chaperone HemW [Actinomycetota bacterium]
MRLYIHWPFCLSRCFYCDFTSQVTSAGVMRRYLEAVSRELVKWSALLLAERKVLRSIYLGGGTPSILKGDEIASLLVEVDGAFAMLSGLEVTVEVNPATWTRRDFEDAAEAGVNRFSIGVQSLDDRTLDLLGRAHNASEARSAVYEARRLRDASISVDLMYALPGDDGGVFERTLGDILELQPHHISLYALTLERGVPMYGKVRSGEIILPEEDVAADQYLLAIKKLRASGYRQYEISNFAMPGHECLHNLGYWRREEYLGVGASAHSLLGRLRLSNPDSLLMYIRRVEENFIAASVVETLSREGELEEEIMLGLRMSGGIRESLLREASVRLAPLQEAGLVTRERGRVALTPLGMLVSNAVISELLCA